MKLSLEETHAIDIRRRYKDLPEFYSEYESPFESDYNRLIHSPTFRRLQGKRQMVPTGESYFFRNRLSHSVELPCYAKQIATRIKTLYPEHCDINQEVLNFACIAHDIGHPPFGHMGDDILTVLMDDAGGYEGNAQTFRLLTSIEKGLINDKRAKLSGNRMGLNLTNRSLLSIVKYNWILGENPYRKDKGYFPEDDRMIKDIWRQYGIETADIPPQNRPKSIECQIMDLADDITNSVMDLEDNLKRGIANLFNLFFPSENLLDIFLKEVFVNDESGMSIHEKKSILYSALNRIFDESNILPIQEDKTKWMKIVGNVYRKTRLLAADGFERSRFMRKLTNTFVSGVEYEPCEECLMFSKVHFREDIRIQVDILKAFQKIFQYNSVNSKELDYSGIHSIRRLYNAFYVDVRMIPNDFQDWYYSTSDVQGLSCHLSKIGREDLLARVRCLRTVSSVEASSGDIHKNEILMGKGDHPVNITRIYSIEEFKNLVVEDFEEDFKQIIYRFRKRIVCDHVACMTDSYCQDTFRRLFVPVPPK